MSSSVHLLLESYFMVLGSGKGVKETHVWSHPALPPSSQKTVAMGSNASLRSSVEFAEIGLLNNELFGGFLEVQSACAQMLMPESLFEFHGTVWISGRPNSVLTEFKMDATGHVHKAMREPMPTHQVVTRVGALG